MKVDLHIHTIYSPDGTVPVKKLLKIAKKRGLGAIAITDHNEIKGAIKAEKLGIIRVIKGIEVSTAAGHVLGYGVDCMIPRGLSVEETAEKIHDCGGIAIIAHPYRFWSGVGERVVRRSANYVDGIEIFNSRCTKRNNIKAKNLWNQIGGIGTAGSDAHFEDEIGRAGIIVQCDDEKDLIDCIKNDNIEVFGTSRTTLGTIRYVRKAVYEWAKRGFRKI